jgi:hypothetical protein
MADAARLAVPRAEDGADLVVVRAVEVRLRAAIERVPGDALPGLVDL